MQTHQSLRMNHAAIARLTSFTWAMLLVAPVFLLTITGLTSRFQFHVLLFITGWLSWTYTEYYFHRFIMHQKDQTKGLGKLFNHSHHHKDPTDIRVNGFHRVLMISGSAGLLFLSVFLDDYFTILTGFVTGFTIYSFMHELLHHKWSVKVFPHLHEFHIHHHCKHQDKCFGVTLTWWDHLFGTIPCKNTVITERIKGFYYSNKIWAAPLSNAVQETFRQPSIVVKLPAVSGRKEGEIQPKN